MATHDGCLWSRHSSSTVALFMSPSLFRPKVKNKTSLDSAKAFSEVINSVFDIDLFATTFELPTAKFVCKAPKKDVNLHTKDPQSSLDDPVLNKNVDSELGAKKPKRFDKALQIREILTLGKI
ncbi:unnamed protein product [Allacma fusca]|uniref:Uncharacterized protein n=1 Tax=Allacma fusca TaxID=39272 RepID=A0A8J2KRT0_9HEXA|nr:unnamed protein product [Allacma fusca]